MTNKDKPILSAAEMYDRDSSFWQYKVCADIRGSYYYRLLYYLLSYWFSNDPETEP